MTKIILISSLVVMLSGCLSPQQIRQQQVETCLGFGFRAGTNQFNQCMTRQAEKAERADACSGTWLRAFSQTDPLDPVGVAMGKAGDAQAACEAGYRPVPQPKRQQDPPVVMPRNTSCTAAGNSINCITY
jgi:hypothetical protein